MTTSKERVQKIIDKATQEGGDLTAWQVAQTRIGRLLTKSSERDSELEDGWERCNVELRKFGPRKGHDEMEATP